MWKSRWRVGLILHGSLRALRVSVVNASPILAPMDQTAYIPGQRVRITQRTPRQSGAMEIAVEGTIVRAGSGKTGSWFAHGKDHKLWLDRLELRRDDGEMVVCNLDQYSQVQVLN